MLVDLRAGGSAELFCWIALSLSEGVCGKVCVAGWGRGVGVPFRVGVQTCWGAGRCGGVVLLSFFIGSYWYARF